MQPDSLDRPAAGVLPVSTLDTDTLLMFVRDYRRWTQGGIPGMDEKTKEGIMEDLEAMEAELLRRKQQG